MKRALISSLLLSAVIVAAPVLSTSALAEPAQQTQPAAKSRAEVKAELAAARRNGDTQAVNSLSYPQLLPYQAKHAQKRAG
jgi:hypothetical protein